MGREYTQFEGGLNSKEAADYINRRQQGVARKAVRSSDDQLRDLQYGYSDANSPRGRGFGLEHIRDDHPGGMDNIYRTIDALETGVKDDNPYWINRADFVKGDQHAIVANSFGDNKDYKPIITGYQKPATAAGTNPTDSALVAGLDNSVAKNTTDVNTATPKEALDKQAIPEGQTTNTREVVAEASNGEQLVKETTPEGVEVVRRENAFDGPITKGVKEIGDTTSVKINPLSKEQRPFSKDALVGAFKGDTRQRQSRTAAEILKEARSGNPYMTADGMPIELTRRGNGKITRTSAEALNRDFAVKQRLAPQIDDVIQKSRLIDSGVDLKNHGIAPDGFDYRQTPVKYMGKKYTATLDIAKDNRSNRNALYEMNIRRDPSLGSGGLDNQNSIRHDGSLVDKSIPNQGEKVNTMAEPEVVKTETPAETLQAEAEAQNPVKREVVAETGNGEQLVKETTPEGVEVTKRENPELDEAIEQARQRQAYENAKSGGGDEFEELKPYRAGEEYHLLEQAYNKEAEKLDDAFWALPSKKRDELEEALTKKVFNGDDAWTERYLLNENGKPSSEFSPQNAYKIRAALEEMGVKPEQLGLPAEGQMTLAEAPRKTGIVKNVKSAESNPVAVLEQEVANPNKQGIIKNLKSSTNDTMQPLAKVKDRVFDGASRRERGFLETIKKDPNTRPELAQELNDMYYVRDTNELQTKAANLVKEDPELAASVAKNTNGDVGVAVGSEYLKYLQDAGRFEEALDIADSLAKRLTEAGRTAQAASIYGRLTPEGVLRFAQKEVARYNQEAGRIGKKKLAQITSGRYNTEQPFLV